MPNRYTTDKATIGGLLSLTGPSIEVPEWQRNYSWTTSQVETFWEDLVAFSNQYPDNTIQDQEYFLGSIVIVDDGTSLLLLDGQQRLATATILLSVIRDSLADYREDASVRLQHSYIADFDDATDMHTYNLTLNRYDREFFKRSIQEFPRAEDHAPPEASLESHRLIDKAAGIFRSRFAERYAELGGGKPAFDWALRIRRVLTDHVSVVVVKSTDEDNAATVFETLNDRGIGLSTTDLLRSLVLRRCSEDDREEIISLWEAVLEVAEDAKVETFLRHYWLSHRGDVKKRALYREIKDTLIQEETDSLDFSRDLERAANVYRDLVAARDDDADLQKLLEDVAMLGATALYPAILSAFALDSVDDRKRIIQALVTFFVRHNVIGNRETTQLEAVVYEIAKDLRNELTADQAVQKLKDAAPTDDQFEDQFKHASVTRHATASYLLRQLERARRATEELEVGPPRKVHVEHIYPKSPPAERRRPDHTAVVSRLGNMTLLDFRLNTAIKNSDFATKKAEAYGKSEILLTHDLLDYDEWDLTSIDARQVSMATLARMLWQFPE